MTDDLFQKTAERLSSPTEEGRKKAVLDLLSLKDRRAIDLLAKLVEIDASVDVRTEARKAYYLLLDIHPENPSEPYIPLPEGISLDDLERLLLDSNIRIRTEAIRVAGKLDPGSVAPTLRTALAAEKNPHLQSGLILALGQARLKYDIPTIARFFESKDPAMRSTAIAALALIGESDAFECIVPLLRDPDTEVRNNATKALPDLDSGEMLNLLRSMAASQNDAFRDAAIFSLQRFKNPVAARLLANLSATDPVIPLREKARAGLEAMARSDENARKVLEELNKPEEPDDPNAPAVVPLDGNWDDLTNEFETPLFGPTATEVTGAPAEPPASATPSEPAPAAPASTTDTPGAPRQARPTAPAKRRLMVVPGITRKLVKQICRGDQALRQDGLRQLAAVLTTDHIPFLLLRLDQEKDPRLGSHLLSLVGKTGSHQAYAAVIKRFKDADDRIRANAIEAAMMIDPFTTPGRIAAFLTDPNNRVRANTILALTAKPDFDPLVATRDLAAFPDPAYRRSALFLIERLKRPSFIEILANLVFDDDMEVRHMAFTLVQEYAEKGDRKAKELVETAGRLMAREKQGAEPDQDFHAAMVAMRTQAGVKKPARKTEKTASEEFGEQLLGTDGLKKAGQTMKNLQEQAKLAKAQAAARLSRTTAAITETDWQQKLLTGAGYVALAMVLFGHLVRAATRFQGDSPFFLLSLAAALLALLLGLILGLLKRPGIAAGVGLGLFLLPSIAALFDLQDSDLLGKPRPPNPSGTPLASAAARIASSGTVLPPGSATARLASVTRPVKPPPAPEVPPAAAAVKILAPTKGSKLLGRFEIQARVTGKPATVEFLLDKISLKVMPFKSEGVVRLDTANTEKYQPGRHIITVRVTDAAGRKAEDLSFVEFRTPLSHIAIASPASGTVFWLDARFSAGVATPDCELVEFLVDDGVIAAFPTDPQGLYGMTIPVATLTEGEHLFAVRAAMSDGRKSFASAPFRVIVPKPMVSFLTPASEQELSGQVEVTLAVDSGWKETGITRLTWFADGAEKGTLASPPWRGTWDATGLELGLHELRAVVENELGHTAETLVRVNVVQPASSDNH